ncbi:MAG: hypothetical protein ACWA6X_12340 [Bauldia sp.]
MNDQLGLFERDFSERIIKPLRAALDGRSIFAWIEGEAERLSRGNRRRAYVSFTDDYRRNLNVLHSYWEAAQGSPGSWTASIKMDGSGHTMRVRPVGAANVRALEAHEFGHALLFSHPKIWKTLQSRTSLVDKAVERLVDDIARALLLPGSLLADFGIDDNFLKYTDIDDQAGKWEIVSFLCDNALVPYRLAISRLAWFAVKGNAAVVSLSLQENAQGSLFETGISTPVVSTDWIMIYSETSIEGERYVFSDRVGTRTEKAVSYDDLRNLMNYQDVRINELVLRVVGDTNRRQLERYTKFALIKLPTGKESVPSRVFVLASEY